MAVTLKDIADLAGFSESTVSRALNNSPLISDTTRQAVLASARRLNYQTTKTPIWPNRTVGVVEPNDGDWAVEPLSWEEPANQPIPRPRRPTTGWRFVQGSAPATGPLLGGCVEVLEFLRGTSTWPPP